MIQYSKQWINCSRESLLETLKTKIKPKRYKHVLRVEQTAIELAKKYGVNPEKASIVALMHDYAKDMLHEEMLILAQKRWDCPDLEKANDNIWHGFAAATIAKELYGVMDEEMLIAISAHTIGWYEMSPLTSVLYIADYMEPGRDFPGVEKARKLAYKDLERAVDFKMSQTIKHLVEEKKELFLPTIEFYNRNIIRRRSK